MTTPLTIWRRWHVLKFDTLVRSIADFIHHMEKRHHMSHPDYSIHQLVVAHRVIHKVDDWFQPRT